MNDYTSQLEEKLQSQGFETFTDRDGMLGVRRGEKYLGSIGSHGEFYCNSKDLNDPLWKHQIERVMQSIEAANTQMTEAPGIIGLISGAFAVLLFGFIICNGELIALDDIIASCFFICFGLFICILCGISLYVNRKAYIHVDDQKIYAFCHYGLALECDLSEVSNVSFGYTGLNIQLKNGKNYNLMNLENAYQIRKYIHKRISGKPAVFPDKDELLSAIPPLRKKRKREGITSIGCFLLLFPGIFLTAALTGFQRRKV